MPQYLVAFQTLACFRFLANLSVLRAMYQMRYDGESALREVVSRAYTIQQLGKEIPQLVRRVHRHKVVRTRQSRQHMRISR